MVGCIVHCTAKNPVNLVRLLGLQQLCKNPVQNLLDIHTECSNIHLFVASWCHLYAIFI